MGILKIIPVNLIGSRKSVQTFALLDYGSAITLLDSKVAKSVGVQRITYKLSIKGITNFDCLKITSTKVSLIIEGEFGQYK